MEPEYSKFSIIFEKIFWNLGNIIEILSLIFLVLSIIKLVTYFISKRQCKTPNKDSLYNSIIYFLLFPCFLVFTIIVKIIGTIPKHLEYHDNIFNIIRFLILIGIIEIITICLFLFFKKIAKHKIYSSGEPYKISKIRLSIFIFIVFVLIFIIVLL